MRHFLSEEIIIKMSLKELSNFTIVSKYAKYLPEQKRRETWDEIVDRSLNMHLKKFSYLPSTDLEEIQKSFELVKEKKVLPSMRSSQFGGEGVENKNERIYNCLKSDTKFITSAGVKSFNDFNDGDKITVLTAEGNWKNALVKNYGKDTLYPIDVKRLRTTHTVYATKNHRWLLNDGQITTELKVGDKLRSSKDIFSSFNYEDANPDERLYWCYGFVYGDGTRIKHKDGSYKYSMLRLCGNDVKYLERFEEMGFESSKPLSCEGDVFVYTGKYLKIAPNPEIDSPNLIKAFVSGYLFADGGKNSNLSDNCFRSIQSSSLEHINFIRNCFPLAGIYIASETELTGFETNYGIRPYTIYFTISNSFAGTSTGRFSVERIGQEGVYEDVWCLEVEDDMSFVLPTGLTTGNCCFLHIHNTRAIEKAFYLLLCGVGCGFGLNKHWVEGFPKLVKEKTDFVVYTIDDSIEGWAGSVKILIDSYLEGNEVTGKKVVFKYDEIRPKGSPISHGGTAPGHTGLKHSHESIVTLLERVPDNKLRTIDVYDILMHTSDAVLSGGIRRAACITLFDKDDDLMMKSKTGDWMTTNPQRARSNNSVLLKRDELSAEEFSEIIINTKEFGEPGFAFVNDENTGLNPCAEISFLPFYNGIPAVQMCNLTTINGTKVKSAEDLAVFTKAAAIIGTLQASYTDFKFLDEADIKMTEEEALLGVSIMGYMSNPKILLDDEILSRNAKYATKINEEWAAKIGINPAARVTCTKPDGNSSCVLESPFSGIHPAHHRKYFRRVQVNKQDPIYQYFKELNPHLCSESVYSATKTDEVITFPIVVENSNALFKQDLSALEHLDIIKNVQNSWVKNGEKNNKKDISHSVSCTVLVEPDDWDKVAEYLYENRDHFTAVSLLGRTGDKEFQQTPYEAVTTPDDYHDWNSMNYSLKPVDYTVITEQKDNTIRARELSCVAGICEL